MTKINETVTTNMEQAQEAQYEYDLPSADEMVGIMEDELDRKEDEINKLREEVENLKRHNDNLHKFSDRMRSDTELHKLASIGVVLENEEYGIIDSGEAVSLIEDLVNAWEDIE